MVFGGAPRAFFGSSGPSGLMGIVCGMCPTCPTKSCLWVAFGFAEINIYVYIYIYASPGFKGNLPLLEICLFLFFPRGLNQMEGCLWIVYAGN